MIDKLLGFLEEVRYPLAVRSSSLLEDSQYQPFSGVYETFMLGNHHADIQLRLEQLLEAIKRVYASTFSQRAKAYIRATPYRLEEEKMAVLLQQVVGAVHDNRFYPDFSGVVRSHDFESVPRVSRDEAVATVALGLGKAITDGRKCLTFCPRFPQDSLQLLSRENALANSQQQFWALNLGRTEDLGEIRFGVEVAEDDGTLQNVGSVCSADNCVTLDNLNRPDTWIVDFSPILKHGLFPLAPILEQLTKVGEEGFGGPVEIEFAVRLPHAPQETAAFGVLQIRSAR